MSKIVAVAAFSFLLMSPALAQESEKVDLPAACQDAPTQGGKMDMSQMDTMMQGMMADMDEVQKANMRSMMKMHDPMMRAVMIKDPDLAFNCGMIAHHQGAIAMAEVELEMGKDDESKKMAQAIIDAQKKEIAEMTAWVEEHAKQ
ncbi:DUF305 domain-containing protein [Pseudaminobacter arsenicus]|uniref:DUF305 domain-containing protein n=1 Tax=Borborobacter arsenicus TaxID=1851146 RepID=A0A432V0P9_9HYPH|nr:DUF305 domain-containing protein [Pseudaminobacter arsenicus]RUM95741.1 DUF305 domain-containing protein [Pseudaminobacter arsenicus]